jgi:hypothetical protein
VRRGDTHLAVENARELFVIALAGVDEDGLNLRMALHFPDERCNLLKIGTCPGDIKDFQSLAHVFEESDDEKQYSSRLRTLVFGVTDSQFWPNPDSFGATAAICYVDFLKEYRIGEELRGCYFLEGLGGWSYSPSVPLSVTRNTQGNQVLHCIATKLTLGFQVMYL